MCGSSHNARHRWWHAQSVWLVCSRRPSGDCGLSVRDGATPSPVYHPHNHPSSSPQPPRAGLWEQVNPRPALPAGGHERAVSSSLFISIGDLWTCFASLFLYVMIKYCLSAQLIPKAKGKSLCPHIICKLSFSLRTDLFTGRESVLYYPAVTLPCLSSLFNVMPSHSWCSVWGLHISFLKGEKGGIKTYLSGNHNLLRGKSLYSHVRGKTRGKKAKALKSSNLTLITL